MAVEWTSDLSVGVPQIDWQHKELFKRVNDLLEAMRAGQGKKEVGKVVEFLRDYVVSHFGSEEELMRQNSYPSASGHKALHEKFVADFRLLEKSILSGDWNSSFVISLQRYLVDWLNNHIGKVDKDLGAFLRSRQNKMAA